MPGISNTNSPAKLHTDRYILLLGSLGILFWNLSMYYYENPVAEIVLCLCALFLGVRVWLLFSKKLTAPIDDLPDRYVETAVIMIYFVTGLIQTFDGHFPDRFRVITYGVIGLVIGMNIKAYFKKNRKL